MLLLGDTGQRRTTPYVTMVMIALCAAGWFYELWLDPVSRRELALNCGILPGSWTIEDAFSALFLHGSSKQLLCNGQGGFHG